MLELLAAGFNFKNCFSTGYSSQNIIVGDKIFWESNLQNRGVGDELEKNKDDMTLLVCAPWYVSAA